MDDFMRLVLFNPLYFLAFVVFNIQLTFWLRSVWRFFKRHVYFITVHTSAVEWAQCADTWHLWGRLMFIRCRIDDNRRRWDLLWFWSHDLLDDFAEEVCK